MNYRREIDGLRSVAVVPVILFHAGIAGFHGGFAGVDVFFVISGYLITSILLEDLQQGRFSLRRFYERRARRILPALCLVLAFTIPVAWALLPPAAMTDFARSLVGVATFASNIVFWREAGYFDTAAELKPLLHTWSLAVEEQYYIIFPLLLAALWRFGRRGIMAAMGALFLLSLGLAVVAVDIKPEAAFFLLPTRAWELLVGALAAAWLRGAPAPPGPMVAQGLSALGLGAILWSIFAFDETTPFPGLPALVPTLGTALIILFALPGTAVNAVLSLRGPVWIGLLSYSLYLWHQPVLAFVRMSGLEIFYDETLVLGLSLGFILAASTAGYYLVERPLRRRAAGQGMIFALSGAALCAMLVLGGGIWALGGVPGRFDRAQLDFLATLERQPPDLSCEDGRLCRIGAEGTAPVALFGDSHSEMFLGTMGAAAQAAGRPLLFAGLGGCPPLLDVYVLEGNYRPGRCRDLAARELERAAAEGVQTVFLIARWSLYLGDNNYGDPKTRYYLSETADGPADLGETARAFRAGLKRTVEAYLAAGVERVVILDQIPQQPTAPHAVIGAALFAGTGADSKLGTLGIPRAAHEAFQALPRQLVAEVAGGDPRIVQLNLDDALCKGAFCQLFDDSGARYYDRYHLSPHGTAPLQDALMQQMR